MYIVNTSVALCDSPAADYERNAVRLGLTGRHTCYIHTFDPSSLRLPLIPTIVITFSGNIIKINEEEGLKRFEVWQTDHH